MNKEEFIKKAKLTHGDKYSYDLVDYKNNHTKVKIICPEHGIFEQRPSKHLVGQGCKYCSKISFSMKRRSSKEEFIKKAKSIHGDKYSYDLVDYKNNHTKVKIICPEHGIFEQEPSNHLVGQGCVYCKNTRISKSKAFSTKEFVEKAKLIHGDKYDYRLVEYVNAKTPIKIICKECGQTFEQTPDNHFSSKLCCSFCNNFKAKTTEGFIMEAKEIHGGLYDYSLVEYVNIKTPVKIICRECGQIFEQIPDKHLRGHGCQLCVKKGERFASSFFKENNIIFETQKIYDDLKDVNYLKFDFYFPNKNILLEIDGEGHRLPVFGRTKEERENNLLLQKKHDDMKNEYCKLNNINLVRIEYNKSDLQQLKKNLEKFIKTIDKKIKM